MLLKNPSGKSWNALSDIQQLAELTQRWSSLSASERAEIYHRGLAGAALGNWRDWRDVDLAANSIIIGAQPIIIGGMDTYRHRGQTGYDLLSRLIDE
jgi:hypothetical protein